MFGTLLGIGIAALLIFYVLGRIRNRQRKELVEIRSKGSLIRDLELKPGDTVTLISDIQRREIGVFSNKPVKALLGVIRNYTIFKQVVNVTNARIDSFNDNYIRLRITGPDEDAIAGA